jgi:membrane-associated phospholipid phosphatase
MMLRRACAGLCISVSALGLCQAANAQTTTGTPPAEATSTENAAGPSAAPVEPSPGIKAAIPGFKDLFTPLPQDFRGMASPQNLTLAGIGLAGAVSAHPADRSVAQSRWGASAVNPFFGPGHTVGGFVVQATAAFGTYFAGRAFDNARIANLGAKLVRAQLVTQATTQAIKFTAQRTRPDGTRLSFPSGHTSSAFATATVLNSEFGWKVGIPAYVMAAWVGASRMERQRHYLSDVIAGATIGILGGRSVTLGTGSARFAISPMAAPGGIGVNFVKVEKK